MDRIPKKFEIQPVYRVQFSNKVFWHRSKVPQRNRMVRGLVFAPPFWTGLYPDLSEGIRKVLLRRLQFSNEVVIYQARVAAAPERCPVFVVVPFHGVGQVPYEFLESDLIQDGSFRSELLHDVIPVPVEKIDDLK